ncbi:MAG: hypothetical protein WC554_15625 [Clostridia bacterium]
MTIMCVREQCQYDRNGVCNNECLINPVYIKLAQIAYDAVLQTMQEGEQTHPLDEWQDVSIGDHIGHAFDHIEKYSLGISTAEDHIAHCLTRLAMARYLEAEQAGKGKGNEISQETGSY